jgi:hypothetical protein
MPQKVYQREASQCDPFGTLAGSSAKYCVHTERKRTKKADDEQTKKDFSCQAKLCGREIWLKVLGGVALYLADRFFNLSNDKWHGAAMPLSMITELLQ